MRYKHILLAALLLGTGAAHAQTKQVKKWAEEMLESKALANAHTGVYIAEVGEAKPIYAYQSNKFFQPASNTKLITLYTALQHLGDSLPTVRYYENDTAIWLKGMGDPTFLHPDFTYQPLLAKLTATYKRIYLVAGVNENERFGPGWAWSDYADYYQPERNELPVYGNITWINWKKGELNYYPKFPLRVEKDVKFTAPNAGRNERTNEFYFQYNPNDTSSLEGEVPFITGTLADVAKLLQDTLKKPVHVYSTLLPTSLSTQILYSVPSDSMLAPLMQHSDNFFAEQTLMMVSSKLLDTISTRKVIQQMLATSLADLPQPPQWVDGSGLSRYNLFTPEDFAAVLQKMYAAYPKERLYQILPTGGKGTLRAYFKEAPNAVHAKTGTLNGCVALSGYLTTVKGKTLVFSILVNNHHDTATNVRRATEAFLMKLYKSY
ncbi:D-alanyl-D-alanine carboxypeptidase/D-alanyl-D-alanine-endopeptidase (penicillin-binding protein 4) [Chitinophaga skermanii]|uniref:D-alanyl-D-alanine carboxypeptidase/D-alanyl-D-alanine-endopeptidase (Penicillin-binding protein 4) n=1 Tax=Chitinophaga skermanii TaxID=331697 RepID=A0A327Q687_9BACT|nr:D-alanyl-D-alanine carboxypeptidase/D-alanyl-D-alanine-endopeptidase [Chitinophaga skermanii]RAI98712.1 D-alanyl-D-alanine carboxypeptidase/D-alanyl-D-alanine-endopeptidase (penicillin-binding protein 4) [Chitinophaga skermanii]